MPLPLMFTPLPMIQQYINLLPSSASLPLMLFLSLVLLCLQLLTQICRAFLNGEPVNPISTLPEHLHSTSLSHAETT